MAKEFKDTININKVRIYFFAISKKQQHIETDKHL